MKKIIVILFLLTIVLSGCTSSEDNISILGYTDFLGMLEESGISFEEGYHIPVRTGWLSVGARQIKIGDDIISIYEYITNQEMENDAGFVQPDGFGISRPDVGTQVSWASYPYWFKGGRIIVNYVGENEQIINFLTEIFGENFAGHRR